MSALALSAESQEFLNQNIEQVEDLEILLLVRGKPQHEWSAIEVGQQIGVDPISVGNRLMRLYLDGFLNHPDSAGRLFQYRHRNHSNRVERCLNELADVFAKSRMEVVNYLVMRQRRQFSQFADAFKVRDRKDG